MSAIPAATPPRKLPWVPIAAVAGGLVLVLSFAFRDKLLGSSDGEEPSADETAEVAETEPTPESMPELEPEAEPKPKPKPPAIEPAVLEEQIAEATSLVNRQKYEDAGVIIDEVLAKIPDEGRALALLAQSHLENNKLEEALTTANDCVAADPSQPFCWITVATVEQNNKNLPRALEAYTKYLELEPDGRHAKSAKKQVSRLGG